MADGQKDAIDRDLIKEVVREVLAEMGVSVTSMWEKIARSTDQRLR